MSLKVLPPERWKQVGSQPPAFVQLSEPMRRFQCNQKGCCCAGWEISFGVEDFVRLHDHLGPEDRAALTPGVQVMLGPLLRARPAFA